VKFLLNMNVPPALGPMLASQGHEWRHVADLGMSRAPDAAVLVEAKGREECVITHDLDYGQLLAFSGDSAPSVLIFRLRRADTRLMHERITTTWHEIQEALANGAVVIVEEAATRIRQLPISKGN
jgi:predicted nuclease of predicted toxin-antitoxin system